MSITKGLINSIVGIAAIIGFGYFTNWQAGILLFIIIWTNELDKKFSARKEPPILTDKVEEDE